MATDFFERQDKAHSKTTLLVVYFILAVLGTIAALYAVIVPTWSFVLTRSKEEVVIDWWNPYFLLWIGLGTIAVVGIFSLSKIQSLRSGGGVVASSLGGRKIEPFNDSAAYQRLLNVVEEMAIASGTPVPDVYVLPEPGINAFAAGFTPDDAAIAVTEGCLDNLSREELQGVIAHEFSHILNGDMRLNIRLMGAIYGIIALTVIGGGMMRGFGRATLISGGSRRRSGNGKGDGGGAVIIAIFLTAIALYVIGYIGVFFGRLIQSAISRQREFLADASAVQFTRNPEGIGGALKRIGGLPQHSAIENPHAEEAAHLFFASGVSSKLGGSFATHPPLNERIAAILPDWDGKFVRTPYPWPDNARCDPHKGPAAAFDPGSPYVSPDIRRKHSQRKPPAKGAQPPPLNPVEMVFTVGTLSAAALEQAQATRKSLDSDFSTARRNPLQARCLLYALVLDPDESRRSQQLGYLQTEAGDEVAETTRELYPRVKKRDRSDYLPMIELALPALAHLSDELSADFQQRLRHLVEIDGKVTIFEFVVTRMVRKHFERRTKKQANPGSYIWSASALGEPLSEVLSALIYLSSPDQADAQRRFNALADLWPPFKNQLTLVPQSKLGFTGLDQALDQLARGAFGLRKQVLRICAAAINDDGKITPDEAELFRALSISLDCPMPPADIQ